MKIAKFIIVYVIFLVLTYFLISYVLWDLAWLKEAKDWSIFNRVMSLLGFIATTGLAVLIDSGIKVKPSNRD